MCRQDEDCCCVWAVVVIVLAATTINVALVLGHGVATCVEVHQPTCDPASQTLLHFLVSPGNWSGARHCPLQRYSSLTLGWGRYCSTDMYKQQAERCIAVAEAALPACAAEFFATAESLTGLVDTNLGVVGLFLILPTLFDYFFFRSGSRLRTLVLLGGSVVCSVGQAVLTGRLLQLLLAHRVCDRPLLAPGAAISPQFLEASLATFLYTLGPVVVNGLLLRARARTTTDDSDEDSLPEHRDSPYLEPHEATFIAGPPTACSCPA
eukprot:GGOE01065184.1.p1 GENE.GGOE01065184.1~~GGOE01065184.1.p1  ORF type:complete len:265 (+),score=61.97 GGOE01065184.1:67-861(+)